MALAARSTPSSRPSIPGLAEAPRATAGSVVVRVDWLRKVSEIDALAAEWSELEAAVQERTVFSTFDYLITWYRHYAGGDSGEALVGVARRGTRLVGVAPLVVGRARVGRVPVTRVSFAIHDAHAGEFLLEDGDPEIIADLIRSLVRTVRFDLICLNGFDAASDPFFALERAAARDGLAIERTPQSHAVVDLRAGYDAYCRAMSANFRRGLRRNAQQIAAAGGAAIGGVFLDDGIDRCEESISRLIAITEVSYKLQGQRLAACHRNSLAELVRRFGPRGMLALPVLSVGGRDAAFLMGLVERGCFYDVSLAYAQSFAELSPGAYLMLQALRRLADAGVHTVVSHGAHDYKRRWATSFVTCSQVLLFSPTMRGAAGRFIRFSLEPLWQFFSPDGASRGAQQLK